MAAVVERETEQNPFVGFLERYRTDPVAFVRDVLGGDPDANQCAIMMAVARGDRQIAVRSGHRVGKTWTMAWLIIWHATTRFPQKTVCTSSTEKQLYEGLAAETKAWFKKLPDAVRELFDVKAESVVLLAAPEESFVSFRTAKAENSEAFAGIHSEHVLLICDEASGIPPEIFESLSGSMAAPNARMILTGNPVRTSGLFFDVFRKLKALWTTFHVSCIGHPRVDPKWIEAKRIEYGGEDDNRFRVRVLGEFPKADDDAIIPFELVEAALTRDVAVNPAAPITWGLDCGRGGDPSALAKRQGNVLVEPTKLRAGRDLMELAGWVKAEYDACGVGEKPVEINVDIIGLGAGVFDRLRELGLPVRGINVAEEAAASDRYGNLRTELWFKGEEWFRRKDCSLRGDENLHGELTPQKYRYRSNGKLEAHSKDDMKALGFKSPNRADAFLLTLASDHITLAHGSRSNAAYNQPLRRKITVV